MGIEWEGEDEYVADAGKVAVAEDDVLDVIEEDVDMGAWLRNEIPALMRRAVSGAVDVKEIIPVLNMAQKLVEAQNGAKGVNEWRVTVTWV